MNQPKPELCIECGQPLRVRLKCRKCGDVLCSEGCGRAHVKGHSMIGTCLIVVALLAVSGLIIGTFFYFLTH